MPKNPFLDSPQFAKVSAYAILKDGVVVGRLLAKYTGQSCEVGLQVFVDPNYGPLAGCNFSKTGKSAESGDRLMLATRRCLKEWGHPSKDSDPDWSLSDIFKTLGYAVFQII